VRKIVERGGILSLWRGNMTSVLHRFPYSAINFFVYENALDVLSKQRLEEEEAETQRQLVRRMTHYVQPPREDSEETDDDYDDDDNNNNNNARSSSSSSPSSHEQKSALSATNSKRSFEDTPALHKFAAGALAGTAACTACYPLDLVRTRLTTELEGREHYRGIVDAFTKIGKAEGLRGFYSGIAPTLLVAVPNFAISYTVYGTLKEFMVDDDLFYNLRKIDADTRESKLGFALTVACGAASGILATLVTFPMDTIRRRMQVQNLHVPEELRMNSRQQLSHLVHKEGLRSLYRGLTPELLKVVPMVGTMFVVYEQAKEILNVTHDRR